MYKKCCKCLKDKEYSEFGKLSKSKDGLRYSCKSCTNEISREKYKNDSSSGKSYFKRDEVKEYRKIYMKEYSSKKENKLKRNKREKERKQIDNLYKIKCSIITLISTSFKRNGYSKKSKMSNIIGCSYEYFKTYIELKFEVDMNWENYGTIWNIDHIYPTSKALDAKELELLNNYLNLRPMYINDNFSKNNKITKEGIDIYQKLKNNDVQ